MQKQMTDADFEKLAVEYDALAAELNKARKAVSDLENRMTQLLTDHGITTIGSPIYKAWGEFNRKRGKSQ